jgi:hypothetical protein
MYNPAINKLDIPKRMLKLRVDERGYPVPKFVKWIDGKPDFRVADQNFLQRAFMQRLCWLCGEPLGRHMAFVIGPMCCINRVSSEPPSHLDCATFAVRACPFLTQPRRRRNDEGLPEDRIAAPGIPFDRNPGVSLVWVTESYTPMQAPNGTLFRLGKPSLLKWYAHGRTATHEEIMESIDGGLPLLQAAARAEGPEAMAALHLAVAQGLALVPGA